MKSARRVRKEPDGEVGIRVGVELQRVQERADVRLGLLVWLDGVDLW